MVKDDLIDAAEEVFDELGSGWTESIYHRAMETELSSRGIEFSSEGTISVMYKGKPVGRRRPDIFVEGKNGTIVVELKAGSSNGEEQLSSYEKILSNDKNFDIESGLLIKFNDTLEMAEIQSKDL